jgi:hypothetical protein
MLRSLFALALTVPSAAFACPGAEMTADAGHSTTATAAVDPTHCAKNAALVGSSCAWSTGMMAQRVQAEGKDLSLTAKLAPQGQALASSVAAPYQAGGYYVIANEVIEQADPSATLAMTGKVLEVDGIRYFLVTSFAKSNT